MAACHNSGVSVRTTIEIPGDLYEALRHCAATEQTSIRSLVIDAIEAKFKRKEKRQPMLSPPVPATGKPGPLSPDTANPYGISFAGLGD